MNTNPEIKLKNKRFRARLLHTCLVFFTVLLWVAVTLIAGLYIVFNGPSQTMSDTVIRSVSETSALKFLPYLFMSEDDVDASLLRTSYGEIKATTDTSLYNFDQTTTQQTLTEYNAGQGTSLSVVEKTEETAAADTEVADDPYGVGPGITIERVIGPSYKGYIAIIDDPSRVFVGISSDFKSGMPGLTVQEFAEKYDATVVVNGGIFDDPNGTGSGGVPGGLLIADGVLYHGATKGRAVAGFDQENHLIVGNLSTQDALDLELRDAVAFGPALIVNGEVSSTAANDVSLNPRTAIGQRADGAVLLLVVDGRQLDSIGASMSDLTEIMLDYGAINACNLDGGSSTAMVANGVQLNDGVAVTGGRAIPTAIIVK